MRAGLRDDRGSAAIFVLMMSVVLMVCAGLVVDGGIGINARMRVADDAEQAARVAADSIDLDQLRDSGTLFIDPGVAAARAASYLRARGYGAGQFVVDVQGVAVTVTVRDTTDTLILSLVGINSYDVKADARSEPETGP